MDSISLGALAVWNHPAKRLPPKARVLLVHGLSEHSGRHLNTVNFLTQQNVEVIRFDLRGAGKSGGRRQWIEHFEDYVDDITQVYNWIRSSCESLPLFVLGHSLGGAIVIYFAAHYGKTLAGLVLSAPAYLVGRGFSPVKIAIGKMLNQLAPTLKIPGAADLSILSRDKEVVKAYEQDPLACHFNTVQQGNEILRALPLIPEKAAKIETPILLVHGSHDRAVPLEGSFEILRKLRSHDRVLQILPGGYHEPHNDLNKEEYFGIVLQWIEKHLPGGNL